MKSGTRHMWLDKMPPETDMVPLHFDESLSLNTEYRALALKELDLGFIVRDRQTGGIAPD
ncbi:hypothetical protein [Neisseria iguanae]|uniref:Uncharacterized protein n=1 Tax=Neisseria iguanae TaxID=90242 RepID=A0A2P7TZX9_9NEIS|nr:hypothetical protein [Neisseria iguanae]PSJ80292.1 hypothetical protein C7N83_07055 [Neisseria iguanae]